MQCALNEALSSASRAGKGHGCHLQDCQTAGQAADAVSALHSGRDGRPSDTAQHSQVSTSRFFLDTLFHNTDGQNHGRTSTTQ